MTTDSGSPPPSGAGSGGAAGSAEADPNATLPGGAQPEGGSGEAATTTSEPEDVRSLKNDLARFRRLAQERDTELKKLREASQTESEKAIGAARKQGYDEAAKKYAELLFASDVRAAAGGVLVDPDDAPRLLDLSAIETDDEGRPVPKSVKAALAALVKEKPYLSAKPTPGNGQGFGGTADQGARGGGAPTDASAWVKGLARQQTGR